MERNRPNPAEQAQQMITTAFDSITTINEEISRLSSLSDQQKIDRCKKRIQANVDHLKIVVANPDVIANGADLQPFHSAISQGTAAVQ